MQRLIKLIFLILLPLNLYAAEVVRYVNTASSGGDGTTNATSGATAAYASLSAWNTAEATNLVTAGDYHKVIVSGAAADTTDFTMSGWTTGPDNYILITTPTGYPDDYSFESASANAVGITLSEDYVRWSGVRFQKTSTSSTIRVAIRVSSTGVGEIRFTNCIFKGVGGSGYKVAGIRLSDNSSVYVFNNNIFYDFTETGSYGAYIGGYSSVEAYFYNNTFHNNDIDLEADTLFELRNNIFQDNTTNDVLETGTPSALSAYNVSDRASVPGTNGIEGEVLFADEAGDDFRLAEGDTVAKDAGESLTCEVYWKAGDFDFEGDPRSSECLGVWDIGADEYYVAADGRFRTLLGAGL